MPTTLPRSRSPHNVLHSSSLTLYQLCYVYLRDTGQSRTLHWKLIVSTAVCDPPCQNDGVCVTPGVCVCRSSWRGDLCNVG